jgi:hypothetical protein
MKFVYGQCARQPLAEGGLVLFEVPIAWASLILAKSHNGHLKISTHAKL